MNTVIQKYMTAFFDIFSSEFARLLKEQKVSIISKDGSVLIRFRLGPLLEEIKKIDARDQNLLLGVDLRTLKNLFKSVLGVATKQAALYGSTFTCYSIDVDAIFEATGVSFSITEPVQEPAVSLFEG